MNRFKIYKRKEKYQHIQNIYIYKNEIIHDLYIKFQL